jgi:tetratricopeptide (TPR) repeat protein
LAALMASLGVASAASADDFTLYARGVFDNALARWQHEAEDPRAAWELGKACFDLAEFATNRTERAEIAEQGLAACRRVLARASNSAAVHYYLAMNLAQMARTKSLGALKLVGQMREEFDLARALDESIDYAGPDRYLGMLYRDAPTVLSIGDRARARQHLERAVALAPNFPANRLILAESYLKWGERRNAHRQLEAFAVAKPGVRATLAGPAWAARWAEWDSDFARYEKQAEEPSQGLQPVKGRD